MEGGVAGGEGGGGGEDGREAGGSMPKAEGVGATREVGERGVPLGGREPHGGAPVLGIILSISFQTMRAPCYRSQSLFW